MSVDGRLALCSRLAATRRELLSTVDRMVEFCHETQEQAFAERDEPAMLEAHALERRAQEVGILLFHRLCSIQDRLMAEVRAEIDASTGRT